MKEPILIIKNAFAKEDLSVKVGTSEEVEDNIHWNFSVIELRSSHSLRIKKHELWLLLSYENMSKVWGAL